MKPFITHTDSDIDITGTSRQGYVQATYDKLVATFGEPHADHGYKSDWEWDIQFPCGTVATVYNYKNGPNYCGDGGYTCQQITTWNVGGMDTRARELIEATLGGAA